MSEQDPGAIKGWHAHVYYDPATKERAAELRDRLGALHPVTLGRMHDGPVGPHPQAMFQIAFGPDTLAAVLPWLALNRGDLAVLVHPETADAVADHRDHAVWMGAVLPLDLSVLTKTE
ncbi:MAG: DOPA 4,5-dioxygenase family protein [Alphaproteobacteria bacterium]